MMSFGSEHFGQLFEASQSERQMQATLETRLLLLATLIDPPAELGEYVAQAIEAQIDWPEFQRLAVAHRLLPFVAKSLGRLEEVPAPVRESIQAAARTWAMRSLHGAANARRARAALSEAGIDSMILKGPALAEMVYNNPGSRMFVDIDLFVAPADLPGALIVMQELGHRPSTWGDWTPERLAVAMRSFHAHDVELSGTDGGMRIELHWRAIGHSFYDRTEAALVATLRDPEAVAARVPFAAQVLIHGAIHGYRRLGWLRDAGALCHTLDDQEWSEVLRLADADHVPNAALLGPYLAHRLFGATIPPVVVDRILDRSEALAALAGCSAMTSPDFPGIEHKGALKMQLMLRDRKQDKLRYLSDKAVRLDRSQMNTKTLGSGARGVGNRLAAQAPKFVSFASTRVRPRLTRSLTDRDGGQSR